MNSKRSTTEANAGLRIVRVPLASLVPDPANARAHGDRNLEAITSSLRAFGQAEPLVVQAGTRRVIAGNGRFVAMKALGWSECDVVELAVDDLQATALGIACNQTAALAEWNEPALAKLLEELRAEDALEGVGFSTAEIDSLLDELRAGVRQEIEDSGPQAPPATPISRAGDLWVLRDHRLLCGDSTNEGDVARLLGGERPKLFATDPPFSVQYSGNNRPILEGKRSGKDWSSVYREIAIEDYGGFLDRVLSAWLARIDPASPIYCWHAHTQQPLVASIFEKHGVLFHQVIVWVKPTPVFTHSYFQWQHEPCAFGWVKGNKPTHGVAQLSTVWEIDWEGKQRIVGNEHPCQKPLRIFEIPIELHTKAGDLVAEPFCGSGSQLVAAEKLSRRCRAMEISPAFVDVAVARWQKATGYEAKLEGDGRSFEAIAKERLAP